MCDFIVENEIDIGDIVLDVIKYMLPALANPAEQNDVLLGKEYINQSGNKQSGTAILEEKVVSPTREQNIITADEGYIGLSSVIVEKIPDSYYEVSVDNQSLILLSGSAEVINGALELK